MKKTDSEKAWFLYGKSKPRWGAVVRNVADEIYKSGRGKIDDRKWFTAGVLTHIETFMDSRVKCDPELLVGADLVKRDTDVGAHDVATMMFDVLGIPLAVWRPVWTRHVGWFVHVVIERQLRGWT